MVGIETHRSFFASLITASAGIPPGSELEFALASTPREQFVGAPPWKILTPAGYIETPSDDATFLYQDVVVSLDSEGPLNNGQPTLHSYCLAAIALKKGERVLHVGAGTGYYTTLLAKLVGETGTVDAYEIQPAFAQRASDNLAEFPQVTVHSRSGAEGLLPTCDVLYVNAGATEPLAVWLGALQPCGRLLFPMTPSAGVGAMLLVTRRDDGSFEARFLVQAQFVPCIGARIDATAEKLTAAFSHGDWDKVASLRLDSAIDESCWCSGPGWWLSKTKAD